MGFFNSKDEPRVVKPADKTTTSMVRPPEMHCSSAEWDLMSGVGGYVSKGRVTRNIKASGEKPGGGRQRR